MNWKMAPRDSPRMQCEQSPAAALEEDQLSWLWGGPQARSILPTPTIVVSLCPNSQDSVLSLCIPRAVFYWGGGRCKVEQGTLGP